MQRADNISIIQIEDREINSPKKIVNAFNKYLVTIANNSITNNLDEKGVQLLGKCETNNILEKKIITTTETEIKKLNHLNKKFYMIKRNFI
jgi:predicted nucleic-acid-binding Zn-ribbon protein